MCLKHKLYSILNIRYFIKKTLNLIINNKYFLYCVKIFNNLANNKNLFLKLFKLFLIFIKIFFNNKKNFF